MTNVSIIGIGQTEVKEHWDSSLRHLAWYAIEAALDDAHTTAVDAVYVGNMLAPQISQQNHLGALVADFAGLRGVEATTVEAAEASGGQAIFSTASRRRRKTRAARSVTTPIALFVGLKASGSASGSTSNQGPASFTSRSREKPLTLWTSR